MACAAGEMELLCTDIRIVMMMRSLTFVHAKFEILTRHPREDVKADGRNEPGFKGVVQAEGVNQEGLSMSINVYLKTGDMMMRSPEQ